MKITTRLAALAALVACTAPVSADFRVTGTFKYVDRPFTYNAGFTSGAPELPIRRAEFQIIDDSSGAVLAADRTADDGTIDIVVPGSGTADVVVYVYSRSKVLGNAARPRPRRQRPDLRAGLRCVRRLGPRHRPGRGHRRLPEDLRGHEAGEPVQHPRPDGLGDAVHRRPGRRQPDPEPDLRLARRLGLVRQRDERVDRRRRRLRRPRRPARVRAHRAQPLLRLRQPRRESHVRPERPGPAALVRRGLGDLLRRRRAAVLGDLRPGLLHGRERERRRQPADPLPLRDRLAVRRVDQGRGRRRCGRHDALGRDRHDRDERHQPGRGRRRARRRTDLRALRGERRPVPLERLRRAREHVGQPDHPQPVERALQPDRLPAARAARGRLLELEHALHARRRRAEQQPGRGGAARPGHLVRRPHAVPTPRRLRLRPATTTGTSSRSASARA